MVDHLTARPILAAPAGLVNQAQGGPVQSANWEPQSVGGRDGVAVTDAEAIAPGHATTRLARDAR